MSVFAPLDTFPADAPADRVIEHDLPSPVPTRLWTPAEVPPGGAPLILVGHPGGRHRADPAVVSRSRRMVHTHRVAVAVMDLPGHGDQAPTQEDLSFRARWRAVQEAGEPVGPLLSAHHAGIAERAVPQWRSVLDALLARADVRPGPVGYWGMSLGGAVGLALVAAEPRITATVLGLVGDPQLRPAAAAITVPTLFLLQWDDELVPREAALDLYDHLGSTRKSLHVNPGGHSAVPLAEQVEAQRLLARAVGGE